jgi:hypothetical protein
MWVFFSLETDGSPPMPIRCCFARMDVALDLCYMSWLKLGFQARQHARTCCHFHYGKSAALWQIAILPPYSLSLKSLDYGSWGILKSKGNATAHLKMGSLKWTVWRLRAAKVRQCCGKTAACASHAWRRLLMAETIAMVPQAMYCSSLPLKTLSWT